MWEVLSLSKVITILVCIYVQVFQIKMILLGQGTNTLFSKKSAHENHPNFPKSLGHRPQPRVILILSNGLESNSQKTPCQNLNGCFSQDHLTNLAWPGVGVTRRTGWNQCALFLKKSVHVESHMGHLKIVFVSHSNSVIQWKSSIFHTLISMESF